MKDVYFELLLRVGDRLWPIAVGLSAIVALAALCARRELAASLGETSRAELEARDTLRRRRAALLDDDASVLWQVHFADR